MARTLNELKNLYARGEKITMLTAYDASFARAAEQAGLDCLLIGDSLGMVVGGYETTTAVTVEEMVWHARAVAVGAPNTWRIVDLPFLSYATIPEALANARRLLGEGRAQMVKLEGGRPAQAEVIAALSAQGISVCAHLGLTPQTVDKLGGYRTVGRNREAEILRAEAQRVAEAGADLLVLECVPQKLAAEITAAAPIPVIGIGCGAGTDGQVLVCYDALGLSPHLPFFSHNFLHGAGIVAAFAAYADAVRNGRFPEQRHARD